MSTPRLGPIGRYLLVVACTCLVLVAIWWSGAVSPRARIEPSGQGTSTQGRALWEARELSNPGPLPVRVTAIDWTTSGVDDPQVRVSSTPATDVLGAIADSEPFAPLTLGPGERTTVVLAGFATCLPGAVEAAPTSRSLTVSLDPPAGPPTRRVERLDVGAVLTVPCD